MGGAKRILIIDDAVFQSEVLKEVFNHEFGNSLKVEIVDGFETAKSLVLQKDFDLILIDFHLGDGKTGVNVKDQLLKETNTKAKWILLSALDVLELKEQYANKGFSEFVHKSDYRIVSECVKAHLLLK